MPTISVFYGITIMMFFNEHNPPHFHVKYNGQKASINIEKLELMEGTIPRRALNLVLDWAEIHQVELKNNWELCRQHKEPLKINPLN